jgi:diaminohydroxyphosphoribosylaminopyrimidine deaminase/5-amino-6-(5-phosphoribosylamino)uracil reductase
VNDAQYMALAIAEAQKALGRTHPNPTVGAVIVKRGRVLATGYHARAGTPHAEAVALTAAGPWAKGATLYSTLEPCNHQGRTPPCTEAIIAAGITRVVYGSPDPNPLVDGKGHHRLQSAGLSVQGEVARAQTDALNRPFFKAMTQGLPWVTLKAGVTLDGKVATSTGRSKWITSPQAREAAHHLRSLADVVLVGVGTVLADDPRLTTRLAGGRTATRLVLDSHLRAPPRAAVFEVGEGRTIVATLEPQTAKRVAVLRARGVDVWTLPGKAGRVSLRPLLRRLAREGLLSLLVEGGATVHGALLEAGLVDEVALFVAPKLFGHGGLTFSGALDVRDPARAVTLGSLRVELVGPDLLVRASVLGQQRRAKQE